MCGEERKEEGRNGMGWLPGFVGYSAFGENDKAQQIKGSKSR